MHTRSHIHGKARTGITLLEVLIAAGILMVGLSGVLAMLPAAASLFREASMSDRAAALASSAAAHMHFRKDFTASLFGPTIKTAVFASNQSNPGTTPVIDAAAFGFEGSTSVPLPDPDPLLTEEAYGRAGYAAIVSPLADAGPYSAGDSARVTIVVFKSRTAETETVDLTYVSSGVYEDSSTQHEDHRKRLLAPCSWIAVQSAGQVHWLQIGSSWTRGSSSFVSFTDATSADAVLPGTVSAFTGVLKVEDHIVQLVD